MCLKTERTLSGLESKDIARLRGLSKITFLFCLFLQSGEW